MKKINWLYLICITSFFACSDELKHQIKADESMQNTLFKGKPLTSRDATKIYKEMIESFYHTEESTKSTSMGKYAYPEYYGGAYIDDKNKLIVMIQKDHIAQLPSTISSLQQNTNVRIVYCDFSFTTLKSIVDKIGIFIKTHKKSKIAKNISVYGIDPSKNQVFVRIKDNSEQAIENFKENISDSPAIYLCKTVDGYQDALTIYPGSQYHVGTTTTWGSFGYRATYSFHQGFVTSGHVISSGEKATTNSGTTELGQCILSEVSNTIDAAFVQCPQGNVLSNQVYLSSDFLSDEIYNPILGESVNLMGAATLGNTGYVSGIYVSVKDEITDITVDDCIEINCSSSKGDSGGIAYVMDDGVGKTVGIIKGTADGKTYCVLAENINEQFNLLMY